MPPTSSTRPSWSRKRARCRRFGRAGRCSRRGVCHRASTPTAAAIISSRRRPEKRWTERGRPKWAGRWHGSGSSTSRPIHPRRGADRSACSGPCRTGSSRSSREPALPRSIREVYLPDHNARFARPPQLEDSAFVAVTDAASLAEILCIEQERIVARDNTVTYDGRNLQLPESRARAHYVKARVKVREYPDGTLAVFHGPRLLARYNATGQTIEGEPERLKTAA